MIDRFGDRIPDLRRRASDEDKNAVCMEHGYIAPRILRPDDLQEMER
jgi:hypothetical protein